MIGMDDFTTNFMEVYAFKMNIDQSVRKRCKYCRYYKTKLLAQDVMAIKGHTDFIERYAGEIEFSICKKASKMALKAIERKEDRSPIITPHNGHCRLFRLSILKIIKGFFNRRGNKQ